ncbi:uncharacterized protein AMSG_05050 [Thecamonas trahens ATCC 50062]|uniref:Uncharacterized protein n=1 Tax=Thecamonas trahens ATCC 50062 TaxID=461836 RepID=A0A0L0DAJ0_THETB|nr:hypothetical protein AMSG_05050 [Thecamonas trahens ATCC 50062]KNC49086.1 hypothetical protein AMSG_05050 [Thecamonas trahens ATCC 50062]|eukprot:XP_013758117.1 hypothetical protein AMSG_05050 [Thecamonas trahens ATCC 50062]
MPRGLNDSASLHAALASSATAAYERLQSSGGSGRTINEEGRGPGEEVVPDALAVVVEQPEAVRSLVSQLDLSHQGMAHVPFVLTDLLPALRILDLSFNDLRALPVARMVSSLPKLTVLDLRHNKLVDLAHISALAALSKLEELHVGGNPLPHVSRRVHLLHKLIYDQMDRYPLTGSGIRPFAGPMAELLTQMSAKSSLGSSTRAELDAMEARGELSRAQHQEAISRIMMRRQGLARAGGSEVVVLDERDPDILCSARRGMTKYLGVSEGEHAPHVIKQQLAQSSVSRLGSDIMYADMRQVPIPRDGPFPSLRVLNGRPVTVEDMDAAERLGISGGTQFSQRLEADAEFVETSDLLSSSSTRAKEKEYQAIYESVLGSAITTIDRMGVERGSTSKSSTAASTLLRSVAADVHARSQRDARHAARKRFTKLVVGREASRKLEVLDPDSKDTGPHEESRYEPRGDDGRRDDDEANAVDAYLELLKKTEAASMISDDDMASVLKNPNSTKKLRQIKTLTSRQRQARRGTIRRVVAPVESDSESSSSADSDVAHLVGEAEVRAPGKVRSKGATSAASDIYYECAVVLDQSHRVIHNSAPPESSTTVYDDRNVVSSHIPFAVYADVPEYDDIAGVARTNSTLLARTVAAPRWVQRNPKLRQRAAQLREAKRAEMAAIEAARRAEAAEERRRERRLGFKSKAELPPHIEVSPLIYQQFQGVRRRVEGVIGLSSARVGRISGATGQQLGEMFQDMDAESIEVALRQADLDLEIDDVRSRSRQQLATEQRYLARMPGVLSSADDIVADDDLAMIVPAKVDESKASTLAAGSAERSDAVTKSATAIFNMQPAELDEFLSTARTNDFDPISALAATETDGGDDDDGEPRLRGRGLSALRGDTSYAPALGKTRAEAAAELEKLQSFTERRMLGYVADMCVHEPDDESKLAAAAIRSELRSRER